ncbi:hypothetical protein ACP70R_021026 [Stipagrostis hirtigluma subsp. patula]
MATPPPPPPRLRRSVPELVDDLILEILLRVPPHRPACLVRCSAVCPSWRRLLTDPAFLRRYRAFHGAPPMLGFLINLNLPPDMRVVARFVRTASFRPRALDHWDWSAHDCRHGRVLFSTHTYGEREPDFAVWNPITDERWELYLSQQSSAEWNAAVLCAAHAGGCDHLDCHSGPFLVVFVGTNDDGLTFACVYSSESAAWSDAITAGHPDGLDVLNMQPSALVGSAIYFVARDSRTIVEYDLGRRQLAFIDPPFAYEGDGVLMPAAGGGLGFAGVRGSCLYLWAREAGPDGTAAWAQRRVIELNTLPTRAPSCKPTAVGFAEGLGTIFVSTDAGVFAIELKSNRVKEVSSRQSIDTVIPYTSFYTPVLCYALIITATPDLFINMMIEKAYIVGLPQT